MVKDPAQLRFEEDQMEAEFANGIIEGHWRMISMDFPTVMFAITATELDGSTSEYCFRGDITNFPAQAPMVRIWDLASNAPLPAQERPKGDARVNLTFQAWGDDTVYRPWDRKCGPHDSQAAINTHLAWRPDRYFSFILRDLHGILNSNARTAALRKSA